MMAHGSDVGYKLQFDFARIISLGSFVLWLVCSSSFGFSPFVARWVQFLHVRICYWIPSVEYSNLTDFVWI